MKPTRYQPTQLLLAMEIIWAIVTVVVAALALRPITQNLMHFPHLFPNIVFIIVLIHYGRHIFLLEFSFLSQHLWVKLLLIFASIPLVFYIILKMNTLQTYLDNDGLDQIYGLLKDEPFTYDRVNLMADYIRREYLFFGTASMVAGIILPFRMVISIWHQYNRSRNK